MSTPTSPDVFKAPAGRGAGIRRLSRRPLYIVFAIGVIVASVVGYTVIQRSEEAAALNRKSGAKKPDPATADGIFAGAPDAGLIPSNEPPAPPSEPRTIVVGAHGEPLRREPGDVDAYRSEWQQYRQQDMQLRQAKMQAATSALTASPTVGEFTSRNVTASAPTPPSLPQFTAPPGGAADNPAERLSRLLQGQEGANDENNARGKNDWLGSKPGAAGYLEHVREAPINEFVLRPGTVVPGTMIGGINSDLPGQITGQVSENVYDTATGSHLLIPQGTRVVGRYDNHVTRGQSRVLVAWTMLIFPDGSSLDIEGMPGADQGGYAGFRDKVNNHYWRVFGDAMLMSLFSAGLQLSQPESEAGAGQYDSQQVIAAAVGQQLAQAGMQMVQRNMNIQPTLQIRPGYRFNIVVTKSVVLPPWRRY